jgi:hypothetical protein
LWWELLLELLASTETSLGSIPTGDELLGLFVRSERLMPSYETREQTWNELHGRMHAPQARPVRPAIEAPKKSAASQWLDQLIISTIKGENSS